MPNVPINKSSRVPFDSETIRRIWWAVSLSLWPLWPACHSFVSFFYLALWPLWPVFSATSAPATQIQGFEHNFPSLTFIINFRQNIILACLLSLIPCRFLHIYTHKNRKYAIAHQGPWTNLHSSAGTFHYCFNFYQRWAALFFWVVSFR